METLVINVDNEKDATALLEQLNQLNYVKNVIWTNKQERFNHVLPGEPLSDDTISALMDEAENDDEELTISTIEDKIKNRFDSVWMSGSSKKRT